MLESKEITFSRKELYDMVWKEPFSRLSQKYKISDNGLRKVCRSMKVPFPRHGYWQKVKSGKKPVRTKFVKKFNGKSDHKLFLRTEDEQSVKNAVSPLKSLMSEIENDDNLQLKVNTKLSNPDTAVKQIQSQLLQLKADRHIDRGLLGYPNNIQSIRVSTASIGRSLRFFDAIIKLLKNRGHEISSNHKGATALIFGEEINISVREKLRITRTDDKYPSNIYHTTGLLAFRCGDFRLKEFKDGRLKIEERLIEILAYLELLGKKEREERIEREAYWAKVEEEERILKESENRKENELKNFKDILEQSVRWRKTKDLRKYIRAFEQDAENRGLKNEELSQWIIWANKKADWYDPFIRANDELLGQY